MRVSVVIPTFNRSGLLVQTVPALLHQKTGEDVAYEVIFVSNGSTDDTDAVLNEAAARFPERIRYYAIAPTGGPSAPRNVGIRCGTGEVVVILDDDVLPDPDLVQRHAEFHQTHPEPHHAALGEAYVPARLSDDPMSLFHEYPYRAVRNLDRLSYLYFWTCNVSVKRQFLLDFGMFDEQFLGYEDTLCGYRLASQGMHLHFLPSARGQHLHQLKPAGLPARAWFLGLWLYAFVERVPERAVKEYYGLLSLDVGLGVFLQRVVRRAAFRLADNPATMAVLRFLGAARGKRSRRSDLYYAILFRRNLLAGYYQAKRQAGDGQRPLSAQNTPHGLTEESHKDASCGATR